MIEHESHDQLNDLVGPCNDKWIDEFEQYYANQILEHRKTVKWAQEKIDEASWVPEQIRSHIKRTISSQVREEREKIEKINRRIKKIKRQIQYERKTVRRQRIHRRHHYYYIYRDHLGRFTRHK